jgi:hypothetical protein
MTEENQQSYVIETTVLPNIFSTIGDTLDLLKECQVPDTELKRIMARTVGAMYGVNDVKKTYIISRKFRNIVRDMTKNKVDLKLVTKDGRRI